MSRKEFRDQVFKRDNGKCVFCELPAQDAHHIMERRLFGESQGYFLNNGASVCEEHHFECERTNISVEQVREACGITQKVIPEHLYDDLTYDKWGNIILPNGTRTKGELFYDDSVQKILQHVLHLFTDYIKYPRTYHLPWSKGIGKDDKVHKNMNNFLDKRVIVTTKLDGENTSLYKNYYHARSVDSKNHPSRNWAKALHATFAHDIPEGWRVCCENLYAKHSIHYDNLKSYLYGISVWNDRNECLSWDESIEWFSLLGIPSVPVIYDGIYDEQKIMDLYDEDKDWETKEGYVLRLFDRFSYSKFKDSVGKYVRVNHITENNHNWMNKAIVPNKLG